MKTKLFTLLTLLVLCVTGAWAEDVVFTAGTTAGLFTTGSSITSAPVTLNVSSDIGGSAQNRNIWKDGSTQKTEAAVQISSSAGSDPTKKYIEIKVASGYKITGVVVRGANGGGTSATTCNAVFCFAGDYSSATGAVTGQGSLAFPGYGGTSDGANVTMTGIVDGTRTIRIYKQVKYDSETKTLNGSSGSNTPSSASNLNIAKITVTYEALGPTISASDASVTATESGVEETQDVAVTGVNLSGSTLTATLTPAVDGLSVTLASNTITAGAISTTATLHYTTSANAKGTTTLRLSDGTTTKDVAITYKAIITAWELQPISEATTWDFTSTDIISGGKQYSGDDKNVEHVYANIAELTCSSAFNAESLAFTGEYPLRSGKGLAQNGCFRIITTVPGTLKFTFSNTGSDKANRYLKVNDQNGTVEADGTTNRTEIFGVPAGEIIIKNVSGEDFTTLSALCYKKIEFVPTVDGDAVTVTSAGYASVVLDDDAYFAATPSITAYAAKANGSSITLTTVSKAPAGTPLIIKASADDYTLQKGGTGVDSPAAVAASINDLQAGPVTGDGASHYVLGKEGSKVGFGLLGNGVNLPATKAYIDASLFSARGFIAFEDGETTGIQTIEARQELLNGDFYNLKGQRVDQPSKGLYILNGKKVIIK